jgi:ATP-binding cassette subfamily B multidrug efflux pump
LLGALMLVVVNAIGAYIPLKIKSAIDLLQGLDDAPVSFLSLGDCFGLCPRNDINSLLIFVLMLACVMAVFRIFSRQIVFGLGRQVEFDYKKDIFNHLVKQEMDYFSKQRTGDLISIITNDVQSLRALSGFATLNIMNTFIAFAVTLPPMFALDQSLTWAFLGLIPLVISSVVLLSDKIKKYQDLVQQSLGAVSNFLEQNISGISIIKTYAQEENEIERFSTENNELKKQYLKLVAIRSFIGPVMRAIASLGLILLLFFGGRAVINSGFSLGDFAAYALYVQRLIWPVASFGWLITVLYRAQVSKKRIDSVLTREPAIKDKPVALNKESLEKDVELVGLNQKIQKGEHITIVGTIASGKSYLANQMMRLFELDDNQIKVDGVCIKDLKLSSLRTLINLVPQETFLFSTSIEENIAYAVDLEHEEVVKLAKAVCLDHEIESFPSSYQTIVGEKGITLSGGQKQRVAIARALALNPEVLIFDDAFSSLDNLSTKKILKNIEEYRQGKTTIYITHKIQLAELSDRTFVMDDLKIVEAGTFEELKKNSKLFKALLNQEKENVEKV